MSGCRLRAHVLDAGGGAKMFQYWQDAALGAACFFRRMPDGVYRCLPSAPQVHFLDAGCTQAVIRSDVGQTPPPWAVDVRRVACAVDVTQSVYGPGEPLAATPAVIYQYDVAEGCHSSETFSAGYLQALPAELTGFVGAIAAHDSGATGVAAQTLMADDGTRETIGGWDVTRGAACGPARAVFGDLYIADEGTLPASNNDWCVPREAALMFGSMFSNSTCSNEVATSLCPSGATPKLVLDVMATSPDGWFCDLALKTVGAVVPRTSIFGSRNGCVTDTPAQNYYFVTPGGPIGGSDYPTLRRIEAGTGRVRLRSPAASSGPPMGVQEHFYDSQLGTDCVSTPASSPRGTICFPDDARSLSYMVGLFADAACTIKVYAWDHHCDRPTPSFLLKDFDLPSRAVAYTGTSLYANGYKNVVGCVPIVPPPGTTLLTAGDPVPPGTFVEIIETTE